MNQATDLAVTAAPERAGADRLPARVKRAIEAQRDRGEILTSWVQAGILIVFATLYFLAPSTSPLPLAMRPVPWALAFYAGFTAVRLYLAYGRRIGPWMRSASVIVDMALLTVTIWSFHLEYGQPAAFYLKAPTFTYFFIFVALRALSFSPAQVLLAGGAAALGWMALLGYALAEPDAMELVTRNYVEYMTSAKILIGGEIDKVISLLLVSALLAIAAGRARQLLERAVAEQAASSQLARFFSPDVAERLITADELLRPGEGESREGAVMFIDLRGFTRLAASLDARALIRLLGDYQHIAVPVIQKHHGSITTYLGDGIMVTFGATRPTDTYAADALRCADELLEALSRWQGPGIGIGIDAGRVICGAIGEEGRLEYAVIGDPVNRAAKIQNHTKAEGVRALASRYARDKALEQGYAPPQAQELRAAREVGGVAGAVDVVVIG
ncbi:MAG: adenylate/guanylate cyclase domain-containing protein [Betaproteobacteria bacterium]